MIVAAVFVVGLMSSPGANAGVVTVGGLLTACQAHPKSHDWFFCVGIMQGVGQVLLGNLTEYKRLVCWPDGTTQAQTAL